MRKYLVSLTALTLIVSLFLILSCTNSVKEEEQLPINLSGFVVNQHNVGIANLAIELSQLELQVQTDSSGYFELVVTESGLLTLGVELTALNDTLQIFDQDENVSYILPLTSYVDTIPTITLIEKTITGKLETTINNFASVAAEVSLGSAKERLRTTLDFDSTTNTYSGVSYTLPSADLSDQTVFVNVFDSLNRFCGRSDTVVYSDTTQIVTIPAFNPVNALPGLTILGKDTALLHNPIELTAYGVDNFAGVISPYTWEFGDGATATGQVVQHTFEKEGVYSVKATGVDNDGHVISTMRDVVVIKYVSLEIKPRIGIVDRYSNNSITYKIGAAALNGFNSTVELGASNGYLSTSPNIPSLFEGRLYLSASELSQGIKQTILTGINGSIVLSKDTISHFYNDEVFNVVAEKNILDSIGDTAVFKISLKDEFRESYGKHFNYILVESSRGWFDLDTLYLDSSVVYSYISTSSFSNSHAVLLIDDTPLSIFCNSYVEDNIKWEIIDLNNQDPQFNKYTHLFLGNDKKVWLSYTVVSHNRHNSITGVLDNNTLLGAYESLPVSQFNIIKNEIWADWMSYFNGDYHWLLSAYNANYQAFELKKMQNVNQERVQSYRLASDHNGLVWLSKEQIWKQSLETYDGQFWTTMESSPSYIPSTEMTFDKNGVLWFGTNRGFLVEYSNSEYTAYKLPYEDDIYNLKVNNLAIDTQDRKWLSTNYNGVFMYNGVDWVHYNIPQNEYYKINNLILDGDDVWVTTEKNIFSIIDGFTTTYTLETAGKVIGIDIKDHVVWIISSQGVASIKNGLLATHFMQGDKIESHFMKLIAMIDGKNGYVVNDKDQLIRITQSR